jgi:hypothetical protein
MAQRSATVLLLACAPVLASASAPGSGSQGAAQAPAAQDTAGPVMRWSLFGTIEPPFAVADQRLVDLDLRPGLELCIVGQSGEVRVVRRPESGRGLAPEILGDLVLPDSKRSLIALARMQPGDGPVDLVVASPRGVGLFAPGADGVLRGELDALLPRARFRLRVDVPTFAEFVQDINGDGQNDLVLPAGEKLDIWIQHEAAHTESGSASGEHGAQEKSGARATFKRAASVRVQVSTSRSTAAEELSSVLASEFTIPRLTLQDVNGDGRADLCVKDADVRAFHLVAADGSIPEQPDVTVDLSIFRDTTPEAELKPGRTLAGGEHQRFETRDLDADGIPDYVIAHRRKVWVFRGTKQGPQFTSPSTILKADDDVTALVLADLDGDTYPDLVLFKVQVPSLGSILRGLVREWEVEIDAVAYKNLGGKTFDTKPGWKNALYLRLPAILSIVRDPQALMQRFEDVGRKFRTPSPGDFDGDGKLDVALVTEDRSGLEIWKGRERVLQDDRASNEAMLRKLVFEDPEHVWDIDRLLAFMGGFAERRTELATGGRPSDARVGLRDPGLYDLTGTYPADVDGDGRAEIVLRYTEHGDGTTLYDVWGAE